MLRKLTIACSLAAPALVAGVAVADEAPGRVRFTSLAPDGVESEVGVRLGLGRLDETDQTLFSLQLDSQYVAPSGLGAYARVEAASIAGIQAVGDVELGGLYRIDQSKHLAVTVRGGLTLPTAGDDQDVNIASIVMTRPSDAIMTAPDATSLRLSVAPTYRSGQVSARADFGFDLVLDSPGYDDGEPLYHADVAIGVTSGHGAGTVELATLGSLDSNADGTYHALSFGGQYDLGGSTPNVTVAIPFGIADGFGFVGYTLLIGIAGGL
jgi:hypothetical protein